MSSQTTNRTVSDSVHDYALDLFATLSPAAQAEIIALAAAAVLRFSPGPLRDPCFNCTSWLCSCSSR